MLNDTKMAKFALAEATLWAEGWVATMVFSLKAVSRWGAAKGTKL